MPYPVGRGAPFLRSGLQRRVRRNPHDEVRTQVRCKFSKSAIAHGLDGANNGCRIHVISSGELPRGKKKSVPRVFQNHAQQFLSAAAELVARLCISDLEGRQPGGMQAFPGRSMRSGTSTVFPQFHLPPPPSIPRCFGPFAIGSEVSAAPEGQSKRRRRKYNVCYVLSRCITFRFAAVISFFDSLYHRCNMCCTELRTRQFFQRIS